ncbi:MAG TPA: type II secretion system protein [Candidatus Saccharimonadales bacterium]|nr:type II secretion system protein [Candidatus Saccharimonadales bacterium]
MSNIKNRKDGFTIIEVLIVLAIAGLIMLIVFLAVPALQRNSRNTQRKNDVANILGAVNEFTNNNGGTLPAAASDFTGNAKLGYYSTSDVTYVTSGTAGTTTSTVYIVKGAKCTNATTTPATGSSRQFAAWYYVETSSGTMGQCQEG